MEIARDGGGAKFWFLSLRGMCCVGRQRASLGLVPFRSVPFLPEQASLVRELLARCKVILLISNSRGLSPCCLFVC